MVRLTSAVIGEGDFLVLLAVDIGLARVAVGPLPGRVDDDFLADALPVPTGSQLDRLDTGIGPELGRLDAGLAALDRGAAGRDRAAAADQHESQEGHRQADA